MSSIGKSGPVNDQIENKFFLWIEDIESMDLWIRGLDIRKDRKDGKNMVAEVSSFIKKTV